MDIREEIIEIWNEQPEDFPDFLWQNQEVFPIVDVRQKKENETLAKKFSGRLRKKLKKKPSSEEEKQLIEQEMEAEFYQFLKKERILCLSEWMEPELLSDFARETKHFYHSVVAFDKTLQQGQIWQAMRNYLIYGVIAELQGEAQNAGIPILAYSLLYPYTDNYIDDKGILRAEKERFNRMIAGKLQGEEVVPQNELEEKVCRLLTMILAEYQGGAGKKVADTLLELLKAQNRSICQQERKGKAIAQDTEAQILEISVAKGGSSVLADYLFATDTWEAGEELFYRKFGLCLQLVDDLQDMEEDSKSGSHTLMTEAAEHARLEARVNRLLWFIWTVIGEFEPKNPGLKEFVRKYCAMITMVAAAQNGRYISGTYIKQLEPYLPFSVDFLKGILKTT